MNIANGSPDTPDYIGWKLELLTGFWIPVQIIAVGLRFYSRWLIHMLWGWDDTFVLVSLGFQMTLAAVGIGDVKSGAMGYHVAYLQHTDPEKLVVWAKYLVAISALYLFSVNIAKLSILVLYHRIFPRRAARIVTYILAAIIVGAMIANTVAVLAACEPFAANWSPNLPGRRCIDKEALFIYSSIPNMLTDIIILIFPLPIIWNLHCNNGMKVGITITFLVGSFGLVTSILRFTCFFKENAFTDGTWSAIELMIWTEVESGVYLISACLVTYRPLLEKMGIGKLTAIVRRRPNHNSFEEKQLPLGGGYRVRAYGERSRRPDSFNQLIRGEQESNGGQISTPSFTPTTTNSDRISEEDSIVDAAGRIRVTTDVRVWSSDNYAVV